MSFYLLEKIKIKMANLINNGKWLLFLSLYIIIEYFMNLLVRGVIIFIKMYYVDKQSLSNFCFKIFCTKIKSTIQSIYHYIYISYNWLSTQQSKIRLAISGQQLVKKHHNLINQSKSEDKCQRISRCSTINTNG